MATREDELNAPAFEISAAIPKARPLNLPWRLPFVAIDLSGNKARYRDARDVASGSIDPDDPSLFDRQCEPAVLQRQRRFAEQLAAPAMQRGDVGMIVSTHLLEVVGVFDRLAGDG